MGYKMKGSSFFTGKDNGGCSRVSSPFKVDELIETEKMTDQQRENLSQGTKDDIAATQGEIASFNLGTTKRNVAEKLLAQKRVDLLGDLKINPQTGKYDVPKAKGKSKMVFKDGKYVVESEDADRIREINRLNKEIEYNQEVADVAETKQEQEDADALIKKNKLADEALIRTNKLSEDAIKHEEGVTERTEQRAEDKFDAGDKKSERSKRLDKRTTNIVEKKEKAEGKKGLIAKLRARRLAKKEDRISDKRDESVAYDKLSAEDKKKYKRGTLKEKQTGEAGGKRTNADRRTAIQNAALMLSK